MQSEIADLELGRSWMPLRRAILSEKPHRERRSIDNGNPFGLQIGYQIPQAGVIHRVMAIRKHHIERPRRNPIKHVTENPQRKPRYADQTRLPRLLQFHQRRNRLMHNLPNNQSINHFHKTQEAERETTLTWSREPNSISWHWRMST